MFTTRIRALAGMSLLASAIGLAALATSVDSTPTHRAYGTYTCYDYATQTFYTCFDPS